MTSFDVTRLRALTRRPKAVWQARHLRLPMWVKDAGIDHRPHACMAVNLDNGMAQMSDAALPPLGPEARVAAVLDAIARLAFDVPRGPQPLPGTLELGNAELAPAVEQALAPLGIAVRTVTATRGVDRACDALAEQANSVQAPTFTAHLALDEVRAFVEAAEAFARAEPWRRFSNKDVIEVVEPRPPAGLRHIIVKGDGRIEYGLLLLPTSWAAEFVRTAGSFEDESSLEASKDRLNEEGFVDLEFSPACKLHPRDHDRFVDDGYAVAGEDRYPLLLNIPPGGRAKSPSPALLRYVAGVLQALAQAQEEQLATGRWTVTLRTQAHSTGYTLCMPDLEDAIEVAGDPALDAEALCDEGWESAGRARALFARKAVALDPECVDAHILLGDGARDMDEVLSHYRAAVAAGELRLGTPDSREALITALQRLGDALLEQNRPSEALPFLERALELDPTDDAGVAHLFVAACVALGRDADGEPWLDRLSRRDAAAANYLRVLIAFRREGDSARSRALLRLARVINPSVASQLAFVLAAAPTAPPPMSSEDDRAAFLCARGQHVAWAATPGALEWLQADPSRA